MAFTPAQLALFERTAEAAVQRALQRISFPKIIHGLVESTTDPAVGIHQVIIDGDAVPIACHDVTTGVDLQPGDRVTVLFAPPHQALIIGYVHTPDAPIIAFTDSGNTNSAGDLMFAHGATVVPRSVHVQLTGPTGAWVSNVRSLTSISAIVNIRHWNGSAVAAFDGDIAFEVLTIL